MIHNFTDSGHSTESTFKLNKGLFLKSVLTYDYTWEDYFECAIKLLFNLVPVAPRFEANDSIDIFGEPAIFRELAASWDGLPSEPITVIIPP